MADRISLISLIDHADAGLLPCFFEHYRAIGVDHFLISLQGAWDDRSCRILERQADVSLWRIDRAKAGETSRVAILGAMAASLNAPWVLQADADEYLELPYKTVRRTIAALDVLGAACLPALVVERSSSADDEAVWGPDKSIGQQFPCYRLMRPGPEGHKHPMGSAKLPLIKLTDDAGGVSPCLPRIGSTAHVPIRAVIGRLPWRGEMAEGKKTATWRTSHHRWLNRDDLIERGFLVRPTRSQIHLASLRRQARFFKKGSTRADRLKARLDRLWGKDGAPGQTPRGRDLTNPQNLLLKPGKICLLTFELAPHLRGGVGTAMAALEGQLRAAGHEVHIVLSPMLPNAIDETCLAHWRAQGIHLHPLARGEVPYGAYGRHFEQCDLVGDVIAKIGPDLVHCPDAGGLGLAIALLRAANLRHRHTRLLVTAHGSSTWHHRGNENRWSGVEAAHSHAHDVMMPLAEDVCFPSRYMGQTLAEAGLTIENAVTLPNSLPADARSFRAAGDRHRPVNELVFFGRIEPRKGFKNFAQAIRMLGDRGYDGFEVTLLGAFGRQLNRRHIEALFDRLSIKISIRSDLGQADAINYLKSRDALVILPSLRDNLPYTLYECLENNIPAIASAVGGMPALVDPADHARVLVAGDPDQLTDALALALEAGWRPGRLSFDPSLVDIGLLAVHAKLVDEARRDRTGSASPERRDRRIAAFAFGDGRRASAGRRRGFEIVDQRSGMLWQLAVNAAVNARALEADVDYFLFCHHTVRPEEMALEALGRLIETDRFDAVVCDFQACLLDDEGTATGRLRAPGGPREFSASRNLYGAGLFAITGVAFRRLGGFDVDPSFDELAHWVLLNRLAAAGGRIAGLPHILAMMHVDHASSLADRLDDHLAEALVRPWIEAAPSHLEGLIRKSVAEDFCNCPAIWTIKKELGSAGRDTGDQAVPDCPKRH